MNDKMAGRNHFGFKALIVKPCPENSQFVDSCDLYSDNSSSLGMIQLLYESFILEIYSGFILPRKITKGRKEANYISQTWRVLYTPAAWWTSLWGCRRQHDSGMRCYVSWNYYKCGCCAPLQAVKVQKKSCLIYKAFAGWYLTGQTLSWNTVLCTVELSGHLLPIWVCNMLCNLVLPQYITDHWNVFLKGLFL